VISQRNSAVPRPPDDWGADARPAIAPDNLDSFARDLRALRGQAGLDYPELAQRSHYTMRTLASAAGGLRLPTLPVISAYVRACGGNVEEWEDRWHKIAKAIEDKRDHEQPLELGQGPEGDRALPAPPGSAPTPRQGPSTVYVITSANPRHPDRLSASARHRLGGIGTYPAIAPFGDGLGMVTELILEK